MYKDPTKFRERFQAWKDGKDVYEAGRPIELSRFEGGKDKEDVDYTIKKGDTLWGIAKKFTGDPSNYIKIAKANLIKNPDLIYTGDVLTIPDSLIINNQKTTNSENKVRHNNKNTTPIDIITDKSNADKIVRNFISNNELHLNDDFTNYKISKIESSNRIKNKQTNDYKSNNVDIPAVSEFIENNKILFVPDKNLQQFLNYKKTDLAEQKTKTTNKTSLKLYELQQVEPFVPTKNAEKGKIKDSLIQKQKLQLYEFKLLEPFVPTKTNSSKKGKINYKLTINESRLKHIAVAHDYLGNSVNIINPSIGDINPNIKIKTSNPIGKIFTNLYNKIPEEYRAPIDILKSGNILGLISYINTAYDRKISNDYKGVKMNRLNVEKAKETPKYRLSEPSTFDVAQAQPQQRTGILGKSISYMNVPYDINVKDYKWHYRLRGDMNPVQHTYGMLAPIFHTMTSKDAPIPGSYNGIIFNPKTGQLSVEPDINKVPEGWLINNTWVQHFDVKGMRKDPNGNLIMVTPDNREYRHNFTTEYELTDGTRKQPNVFTDMNNRDPKTLGAKAGGHFFISAQPKKGNRQVRLVHGSLQHLSDAIDRLKANTNTDYVTVYPLDGGSFSMGYIPQKAINLQGMLWITIEPDELNKYQYQNSYGSSGFMPVESLPIIPDTTYIDNEINNGYKYGKDAILGFEGGLDNDLPLGDQFLKEVTVTAPKPLWLRKQEYLQHPEQWSTTSEIDPLGRPRVIGMSGTDPVGEFVVANAVLNPIFNAAGKAALYGLGRAGNNWARAKLISGALDKSTLRIPNSTPKVLMTPSVDYSSPVDTKSLFDEKRRIDYINMISGVKTYTGRDIAKDPYMCLIKPEHLGVEFPIPQEALLILINSTLPRMKAMRPWMNQQQLDEYLRGLIDTKYTEFPEEAFKIADPDRYNFAASYTPETDFINKIKGVDPIWAMSHEVRHRLDYFEPLVEAEENYLEKAYGQIFKDIPNNYPELSGYKSMPKEMVTTNQDARTALLGEYHTANTDWQLLNKIIDRKSDDAIIAAIRNANGYGRRFIEQLEKNNGITPERLLAIRDAMKYVGISSVPITVGSSMLPTNNETYNGFKHGKDSGIHIKPSHRGKFTSLKKRTGHSASWFKAHGTPALKKMATFALNARKWKH